MPYRNPCRDCKASIAKMNVWRCIIRSHRPGNMKFSQFRKAERFTGLTLMRMEQQRSCR